MRDHHPPHRDSGERSEDHACPINPFILADQQHDRSNRSRPSHHRHSHGEDGYIFDLGRIDDFLCPFFAAFRHNELDFAKFYPTLDGPAAFRQIRATAPLESAPTETLTEAELEKIKKILERECGADGPHQEVIDRLISRR